MGHIMWWSHHDRKILDKIWDLLKDISRNGAAKGIGKPERLKHQDAWSRRITDEHRLIYNVDEKYIHVISCKGHYE
ncbi:MAG: Txe/YoeB family addiction module toxin [Selenomonadaceae bacterium]|nr:Txe/YoeB family addiction module toxin [Selenomonadaceae bacterium]